MQYSLLEWSADAIGSIKVWLFIIEPFVIMPNSTGCYKIRENTCNHFLKRWIKLRGMQTQNTWMKMKRFFLDLRAHLGSTDLHPGSFCPPFWAPWCLWKALSPSVRTLHCFWWSCAACNNGQAWLVMVLCMNFTCLCILMCMNWHGRFSCET